MWFYSNVSKMSRSMTEPTKWYVSPVWSESSLSAWRNLGSLFTQWVHSEDSDQTERVPRLICHCWAHSHFVGFVMLWLRWSWNDEHCGPWSDCCSWMSSLIWFYTVCPDHHGLWPLYVTMYLIMLSKLAGSCDQSYCSLSHDLRWHIFSLCQ